MTRCFNKFRFKQTRRGKCCRRKRNYCENLEFWLCSPRSMVTSQLWIPRWFFFHVGFFIHYWLLHGDRFSSLFIKISEGWTEKSLWWNLIDEAEWNWWIWVRNFDLSKNFQYNPLIRSPHRTSIRYLKFQPHILIS